MPQYTLGFSERAWRNLTGAEREAIRVKVTQFQMLLSRIEKQAMLRPSQSSSYSPGVTPDEAQERMWEQLFEMLKRGPRI